MGQRPVRGPAVIGVAVVTVLGLLAYSFQWSSLQSHLTSPWQQKTNVKEKSNRHVYMNQTDRLLEYSPPSLPCSGVKSHDLNTRPAAEILGPAEFVSQSRNPCWWNSSRAGTGSQLSCLPYFFLAGVSKCGSTDIFYRLSEHPQILAPSQKEPCWFDWRRYVPGKDSLEWYVSNFLKASQQISSDIDSGGFSSKIVGDGSPTYFWRNFHWAQYPGNEGCSEPRILIPDILHRMLPHAKIIISFRNPVHSLYSKYLAQADHGVYRSPQHFHSVVEREILRYQDCFTRSSVRSCTYNITLSEQAEVRLEKGLYAVFLSDWFRVFPRQQFHVVRFEDYITDITGHLQDMFQFLEVGAMADNNLSSLARLPAFHQGHHYSVGPMLPATQRLLQQFYSRFNAQLADLMLDKRYLWLP